MALELGLPLRKRSAIFNCYPSYPAATAVHGQNRGRFRVPSAAHLNRKGTSDRPLTATLPPRLVVSLQKRNLINLPFGTRMRRRLSFGNDRRHLAEGSE